MRKEKLLVYLIPFCSIFMLISLVLLIKGMIDPERTAFKMYQEGKLQLAQSILGQVQVDRPNDSEIAYNLGVVNYKLGDFEAAKLGFLNSIGKIEKNKGFHSGSYFNAGLSDLRSAFSDKMPKNWFNDTNFINHAIGRAESAFTLFQSAVECQQDNEKAVNAVKKTRELLEVLRQALKDLESKKEDKNNGDGNKTGGSDDGRRDENTGSGSKSGQGSDGDSRDAGDRDGSCAGQERAGSSGSSSAPKSGQEGAGSGVCQKGQSSAEQLGQETGRGSRESMGQFGQNGREQASEEISEQQLQSSREKSGRELGQETGRGSRESMGQLGQDEREQTSEKISKQQLQSSGEKPGRKLGQETGRGSRESKEQQTEQSISGELEQGFEQESDETEKRLVKRSGKSIKDRSIESLIKTLSIKDSELGKQRMKGRLLSPSSEKRW